MGDRSVRKRLGMLEKHKDYVERAKKHHEDVAELEAIEKCVLEVSLLICGCRG